MRTGQRDVHNTPLKRRLSISYEELETLKKSIKISVLNELRAEVENVSDQESFKDLVLSEIRTELMGIPDPALLKASILKELRMEINASRERDSGDAERRLKELAGIQEGLVRELLDQKTIVKKLESDINNLNKKLENIKNPAPAPSPTINFTLPEDPLDLPPFSIKPKHKPELCKESSSRYELTEFRETPAPLPGTSTKVKLKIKEIEPRELEEEIETKCEYIIAESGDKRRFAGNMRQQTSTGTEQARQTSFSRQTTPLRQLASRQSPPLRHPPVKAGSQKAPHEDDYKCEYIIAEKTSKKYLIEESVDLRESEDAEIITCSRKTVMPK